MSRVELSPGDLLMEILYGHLQCGLFALGPLFADSRPGPSSKVFVWGLSLGICHLVTFAWDYSFGNVLRGLCFLEFSIESGREENATPKLLI